MTRKQSAVARWRALPAKVRSYLIERAGSYLLCSNCHELSQYDETIMAAKLCGECLTRRERGRLTAAVLREAAKPKPRKRRK